MGPLVKNFGHAPTSEDRARRFARSAERQARKGVRYIVGQIGRDWVVRRHTEVKTDGKA